MYIIYYVDAAAGGNRDVGVWKSKVTHERLKESNSL